MKNYYYYYFFFFLFSHLSWGQCVNGISTNPNNPSNPQNPNYLNNFNWQVGQTLQYNTICQPNSQTLNPFFSQQTEMLPLSLIEDYKTENGWEAVAYNLGYDNNNIQLASKPEHAFIMLYNKYRGILRILVKWCRNSNYNGATLTLEFAPGFQTNLLDMTTYEKPLLTPHNPNPSYTTALNFYNDNTSWAYADFKVNYDPCTCNFTENSRLKLYTELIQNSNVYMTGAINGTITSITNGNGSSASDGNFWKTAGSISGAMTKAHKGINSFVQNYESIYTNLADNGVTINAIRDIGSFMQNNQFLKSGLKSVPYVAGGLKFISGLFGGGGGNGPLQLAPLSVNLAVKLEGTITTRDPMHNYTIGLPGSQNSGILPGTYGGQPLYNEPLGVFTLIDEPVMYYTETYVDKTEDGYKYERPTSGPAIYSLTKIGATKNKFRHTTRNYKLDGKNLRYLINPASNLEIQDAQFMIIAEYQKPSFGYKANMPQYTELNTNVNVDINNGLPIKITNTTGIPNEFVNSSIGDAIDRGNYIFQNSFPVIGEKAFKNDYQFSFLYDIQRIANNNPYFNFAVENLSVKNTNNLRTNYYVIPKSEYTAPRIKNFKLKIILNLKRTDNPNAQNVLYAVTYPIKIEAAPAGYNMTGSNYSSDAQNYANNTAQIVNKFTPILSGELANICSSTIYKNNRNSTANRIGISSKDETTKSSNINLINFYPNPVIDYLTIDLNGSQLINITSLEGKELKSFNKDESINSDSIKLDFNNFSKGMYFINYLDIQNNTKTIKIIKQ